MERLNRWLYNLWNFLASRRLAVILLVTLPIVLLFISLFPQMPAEAASQESWLEAASLRYGSATSLLRTLGMFGAYHSWWFLGLLAVLLINTLVCTVQRLQRIRRSSTESPSVRRPAAFFETAAESAHLVLGSADQALSVTRDVLRRQRFSAHVECDETTGAAFLSAEKGAWSQVGTFVSHFSAVLLIVALACRPALSWQESNLKLLPGEMHRVGHGTNLELRVGHSVDDRPVSVPVEVSVEGSTISRTVRLNKPLTVRDVSLHLLSTGPAIQATAPEGTFEAVLSRNVARRIALPEADLTLQIALQPGENVLFVEASTADGSLVGSGSVSSGQEVEIAGVPIKFDLVQYSTWQASHDPTFGIAVFSALLLLVGVVVSLWVPHRWLWVQVDSEGCASMAGAGDWGDAFDVLANEIARGCLRPGDSDG